jgi:hypothetical protein
MIRRLKKFQKAPPPSIRAARAKMINVLIKGFVSNSNSALGVRNINRIKGWAIVLLEITSGITTCIGMIIVASDISPIIAILWALVIQGLAGALSVYRKGWNAAILAVCLIFSVASDYVCYVNAVLPYDSYLESEYNSFKESYDFAWNHALGLVQKYDEPNTKIDAIFRSISDNISSLSIYSASLLKLEMANNEQLKDELEKIQPQIRTQTNSSTTYTEDGATHTSNNTASGSNPSYTLKEADIKISDQEIDALNREILRLEQLEAEFNMLNAEEIKSLIANFQFESDLSFFDNQLLQVQQELNILLQRAGREPLALLSLPDLRHGNVAFQELLAIKLPSFDELRTQTASENTIFDVLFESLATLIDSEFAINATDLREIAASHTSNYYHQFIAVVSNADDTELQLLIYDNEVGGASSRIQP